jgi:putative transcriptional regulator
VDAQAARTRVCTPLTYIRHWLIVAPVIDEDIFEQLLDARRRIRRRQLETLARLTGLGRRKVSSDVDVRAIRAATGLSQAKFSELLSIEVATLRNWEQGRREPTGAARALLRAIRNNPIAVIKALSG